MRYPSIVLILFFISISCSGQKEQQEAVSVPSGSFTIDESRSLMGQIEQMEVEDSLSVILDNNNVLHVLSGNQIRHSIARSGGGPCEYAGVTHFSIRDSLITVVSSSAAKTVTYDLTTGECLSEFSDETFTRVNAVFDLGGAFYFLRSSISSLDSPDTPVILKLQSDEGDGVEEVGITVEDLDVTMTDFPIVTRSPSDKIESKLIFYYLLTDKVHVYDTSQESFTSVPVDIDLAEEEGFFDANVNRQIELMNSEVEVVLSLYAWEDYFALIYRRGSGEDMIWGVRFFDYEGRKVGEEIVPDFPVHMTDSTIVLQSREVGTGLERTLTEYEYTLD